MVDTCRFCGKGESGKNFDRWVKPTFTDFDKILPGNVVCDKCLFWFDEASVELAQKMGKDKPQRMRNYSHFIVSGEWIPLSKGQKREMVRLLNNKPFPELAVIAESGQKHIVFRANRNVPNTMGSGGWVQFEEQTIWVAPGQLKYIIDLVEEFMTIFSKSEIESGSYLSYRIMRFGIQKWHSLEQKIKLQRGSSLFRLAIFLAQKRGDSDARDSSGYVRNSMARDRKRVQKQVPPDDLATVRGCNPRSQLYQQSGQIHQYSLFEAGREDTD